MDTIISGNEKFIRLIREMPAEEAVEAEQFMKLVSEIADGKEEDEVKEIRV